MWHNLENVFLRDEWIFLRFLYTFKTLNLEFRAPDFTLEVSNRACSVNFVSTVDELVLFVLFGHFKAHGTLEFFQFSLGL